MLQRTGYILILFFQVLAQSICMKYNRYIKCERPAPSSKSKNFLLVQTVCMGRYFVLRDRRSVWAWQFLLFAAWLTAGTNNDTATEYRLREWWGRYVCFCGCCLILQSFFHSDSVSDHIILFNKDLRLLLSMGFGWCQVLPNAIRHSVKFEFQVATNLHMKK